MTEQTQTKKNLAARFGTLTSLYIGKTRDRVTEDGKTIKGGAYARGVITGADGTEYKIVSYLGSAVEALKEIGQGGKIFCRGENTKQNAEGGKYQETVFKVLWAMKGKEPGAAPVQTEETVGAGDKDDGIPF